jgi:chorismate-pyruvate lyase
MQVLEFLGNPGSTTKLFKALTDDYVLEILGCGVYAGVFQRITLIKLDQIPVMLGLSVTQTTNPLFMDIIQNTATAPIGNRLFDADSTISRGEMIVRKIAINDIANQVVFKYVRDMNIDDELYYRYSVFRSGQEAMELNEYILPGLEVILNKYTM